MNLSFLKDLYQGPGLREGAGYVSVYLDTSATEASGSIEIRQRQTIGFITIARTMFTTYPRRAVLGFSLFIGQAFLYNAITFGYAQILATFSASRRIPATTSR
jgi:hypothetical protein